MSDLSTLSLLLALVVTSLFVVNAVNQRQLRARLLNQRLERMKRRVDELEELVVALERLVDNPQIVRAINRECLDMLEKMVELAPDNPYYQLSLDTAQQTATDFHDGRRKIALDRLMDSDAALARAHLQLTECANILRNLQAREVIQSAQLDSFIADLSWADMMSAVVTNIGHGHKAVSNGELIRAHGFYQKALKMASGHSGDPRLSQLTTEIAEVIANKRPALSTNLMPETRYNPSSARPELSDSDDFKSLVKPLRT